MKFKEFVEMALKGFHLGPFEQPIKGSHPVRTISVADEKTLRHPKTHRQLEKVLKTSTHFDFNIIIGQPPAFGGRKEFINFAKEVCQKEGYPLEGHITFVKGSSTGDTLTAWMLLHNIGHAILDNHPEIMKALKAYVYQLEMSLVNRVGLDSDMRLNTLSRLFKFRSARIRLEKPGNKASVLDEEELIHELMAEYLWHGKIRLNESTPRILQIINFIQIMLHSSLEQSVGTIVVDY